MTGKSKGANKILWDMELLEFARRHVESNSSSSRSQTEAYALLKYAMNKRITSKAEIQKTGTNPVSEYMKIIQRNYDFLERIDPEGKRIMEFPYLLLKEPEVLEANYKIFTGIGATDKKIATNMEKMGIDPRKNREMLADLRDMGEDDGSIAHNLYLFGTSKNTLRRNSKKLAKLVAEDRRTKSRAALLGRDTDLIKTNYAFVKDLGASKRRIDANAHILGRKTRTIRKYYQDHIGLLREYGSESGRESGKGVMLRNLSLLGIPRETVLSNVQYLGNFKVGSEDVGPTSYGMMLASRPQKKREKLAWILREIFHYRDIPSERKKEAINHLYGFVSENPYLLIYSVNRLENQKDKLMRKARKYIQHYAPCQNITTL